MSIPDAHPHEAAHETRQQRHRCRCPKLHRADDFAQLHPSRLLDRQRSSGFELQRAQYDALGVDGRGVQDWNPEPVLR
jgi:hypothetical protein